MGKLIYSMSVSLDGFVETPSRSLDWVLVDEELHSFFNDEARDMSAFLYGRRMYELMVDYWPTAESDPTATAAELDFARIWKDKPKIVFSRTLERVGWNGRLVRDGAVDEVARLKAQPGFDMGVGGPTIAATFARAGLIDEYRVFVHPVILGSGTPYFPPLENRLGLKLLDTRNFGSGVVYLRYETIGAAE
jgi:dihydrofolate reductase